VGKPGRVVRSVNNETEGLCVDIFVREDGSFGFQEYRRDVEDPSGWFPIGHHLYREFAGEDDAFEAACATVAWLGARAR
jgi:hypothetical protein